ncbi:chlorinating enzyme [Pseudoalteromonas luteoviolacea]|nr:chlorinating enzyme [Pseudoalteromonas luteoviolacea]
MMLEEQIEPCLAEDFSFSKEELEQFRRQGFAGPFTAYTPEEMTEKFKKLRPKLVDSRKSIYRGDDGISGSTNISNYDRHLDIDFLADHICKREIVDRVASILGRDLLCWRTEFFPKYPGDEGTDWHQAGTFANVAASKKPQIEWPEGSEHSGTITVWTAFTESTIENGCLQIMPGTHKTMNYDETKELTYDESQINSVEKDGIKRGFFGYDYRQLQKDPNWKPDESQAVPLVMKPGQFVIFWSTLMHASYPHSGEKNMRLGYAARYVPTDVKVYPYSQSLDEFGANASLDNHGSVLVSGTDSIGHNALIEKTFNNTPFNRREW